MEVRIMNRTKLRALGIAGLLFTALVLSGCSGSRISLADKGLVSVEKQHSPAVRILWTDVYQQNGHIYVYGVLEQTGRGTASIRTHVDIQVLNPDGDSAYETITEDVLLPRIRAGKGPHWRRFIAQLPEKLSEGSKVLMMVHTGRHEQTKDEPL